MLHRGKMDSALRRLSKIKLCDAAKCCHNVIEAEAARGESPKSMILVPWQAGTSNLRSERETMRLMSNTAVALTLTLAAPAFAQDQTAPPPAITITGNVAIVSDYRMRGVSLSDTKPAIQGGITIAHKSGLYGGLWASNLAGWGTFGGPNLELDAIGGFKTGVGDGTLDVGLTWYNYPGGARLTDFVEFFGRYGGTIGPVSLTAGVYYAPPQLSLGNFANTPQSRGQRQDNIYVTGDATVGIPKTPFTLTAHIGNSTGNPGLGPNGRSVTPTGQYWDWSLGSDITYRNLTLNVSYIGTSITARNSAYLLPQFSRGQNGSGSIANGTVVVGLIASF